MKLMRFAIMSMLLGAGSGLIAADFAGAQPFPFPAPGGRRIIAPRTPVAPRPPVVRRSLVVMSPGWPLKRAPRPVVVRPPRGPVRPYIAPRVFLPPVVFSGGVVVERRSHRYTHDDGRSGDHDRGHGYGYSYGYGYSRESLVWRDSETLFREDEWTEFILDCNAHGSKLWFEVLEGRLQVDWAEVVFENGEAQVVEFPKRTVGPGMYPLLDMREGRRVDHVRMVAKTASREAKLTLWLAR